MELTTIAIEIDDGVGSTYYADSDGDGYGDSNITDIKCALEVGWTDVLGDCDDANNTVYPQADEFCDGIDNDCIQKLTMEVRFYFILIVTTMDLGAYKRLLNPAFHQKVM